MDLPSNTDYVCNVVYNKNKRRIHLAESYEISLSCIAFLAATHGDLSTTSLISACQAEHEGRMHYERERNGKVKVVQQHAPRLYPGDIEEYPHPEDVRPSQELTNDVQATLASLKPSDADVLERAYMDLRGPTLAVLAEEDGIEVDTMKKRVRRAKARFASEYRRKA